MNNRIIKFLNARAAIFLPAGIVILGLLLRLYRLDSKVLCYDEADTLACATRDLILFRDPSVFYKPVYFLLLRFWVFFFGIEPVMLRLPSVIFGVLSIYALYRLGREFFSEKVGIYAAFFLALSPFHVYHSQQARHFTLIVFLAICAYYFLLRYKNTHAPKDILLSFIFVLLTVLTHPYGIFVMISHGAIFVVFFRKEDRKWLVLTAFLQAVYFIFLVRNNMHAFKVLTWWMPLPSMHGFIDMLEIFAAGGNHYGLGKDSLYTELYDINPFFGVINRAGMYLVVFLFCLGVIYIARLMRREKNIAGVLILFGGVLLPLILLSIGSYFFFPVFAIKHFLIILPFYYLVIACGLSLIKQNILKRIAIFSLIIVWAGTLSAIYCFDLHINWKIPAEKLRHEARKGDAVLLGSEKEVVIFMYFFRDKQRKMISDITYWGGVNKDGLLTEIFQENGCTFVLINAKERVDFARKTVDDFMSKVKYFQNKKRIWLVMSRWVDPEACEVMRAYLIENGFHVEYRSEDNGVKILLFRKNK